MKLDRICNLSQEQRLDLVSQFVISVLINHHTCIDCQARKSYEGTAPGLSLQGPFNPSIVAALSAKHGDRTEDKRKREGGLFTYRAHVYNVTLGPA